MLTPSQEEHLQRIKDNFTERVDSKFRAGAAEHGGELEDVHIKKLLEWAEEEVLDMWVYIFTLEEQLSHLEELN